MSGLLVRSIGPACAFQDLGRPGFLASGLTQGGASDPIALHEGAALLRHAPDVAALEMGGMGHTFEAMGQVRIALTGADMGASIDGTAAAWNASHLLNNGAVLTIGAARRGTFGYLHIGGGFDAPVHLGTRGAHLSAGLGQLVSAGDVLNGLTDKGGETGLYLPPEARLDGGTIRVVPSVQTDKFSGDTLARFQATTFRRDPRGNRQGMRMDFDGEGFHAAGQLNIVSEIVVPGDIQITGDGTPFVLMHECQTTGGYPRIGTVLPADLSKISQAPIGATFQFEFLTFDQAAATQARANAALASLRKSVKPLLRDPSTMQDLLSYQLISGAISAAPEEG